jgi:hypothetical protein
MTLFGPDFYPTPPEVAAAMLDPLDLRGRVVVEPSSGSGNLVRECLARGAAEVLTVEPEPELRAILAAIPDSRLIGADWLTVTAEQVSHVDAIVMNPPFSADEDHILHAWQVAPPGCEIVSLANWRTLDPWRATSKQAQVAKLIEGYGSKENLGPVFTDAERTTQVPIGLLRLTKPGARPGADEFDGFFLGADDIEAQGHGLIPYRRSRDIVNRYVEACRIFDEQVAAGVRLCNVLDGFFGKDLGLQVTIEGQPVARNRFRKDLQKQAWQHVFDEFLPQAMATSQLAKDINRFVEQQSRIPFTERNIYRMLQIVAGTQEQRIDRAVEEAIDSLTRYTKENRYGVEGWATNSGYMLNQRFIRPHMAELAYSNPRMVRLQTYGPSWDEIRDLIKACCFITGRAFEEVGTPERISENQYWPGDWHDWGFFLFRPYKKGTVHFEFKDREVWAALNARYARIKGQVLPEQQHRPKGRRKQPVAA